MRRGAVRRSAVMGSVAVLAVVLAACLPPNPGPDRPLPRQAGEHRPGGHAEEQPRHLGLGAGDRRALRRHAVRRHQHRDPDPRPPLLANGNEPLRLWVANPNNGVTNRPAIVWLHGGGFAVGIDSMYGLANGTGKEYAQRGYVGFSVEYRTDTTLVGTGTATNRPPSLCQWVQDNDDPGDPTWEARRAQCTAQHHRRPARHLRRPCGGSAPTPPQYDIDPTKIAVGGFSAGAVTAANLAYRSDDVGTIPLLRRRRPSVPQSQRASRRSVPPAASTAWTAVRSPTIGPGDAPISFIHSRFDQAVPYACVANTVTTARAKGLVAELTSYCTESGHAENLYARAQGGHRRAVDDVPRPPAQHLQRHAPALR